MLKGRDVKGKGDVEGKGDGKPVVGSGEAHHRALWCRALVAEYGWWCCAFIRCYATFTSRCRSVFALSFCVCAVFHVRVTWSSRAVVMCCRRCVSLSCCCSVPHLLVVCPGRVVVPRHRCAMSSLRRPCAPSLSCVSARWVGENVGWGALTVVS
jgi:hypothetical protein